MNGILTDNKFCTSCAACENICPKDAISMQLDQNGFLRPTVNATKCIHCGLCEKKCPALKRITNPNCNFEVPIVYAAFAKDEQIRIKSSSGGMFTILAKAVLNQGGVVFGVCQESPTSIYHTYVESIADLEKLRGSKYLQSNPDKIYQKAKDFLSKGRKVLFSGTPCQIAALYSYLGERRYDNLYTIDIVCHGTPSFKVFQKYIQEIELQKQGSVKKTFFRDKRLGWKQYSMTNVIEYCKGNSFQSSNTLQEDIFLKTFLSNISLNESCYSCKYNGIPRLADVTLGDFWGVQRFHRNMDDDKGTSVILLNNTKGEYLFSLVEKNVTFCKSELNKAVNNNPCIIHSYPAHHQRDKFLKDLDSFTLGELLDKYKL